MPAYMRYVEPCLLMGLSLSFTLLPMITSWGGLLLVMLAPFPLLILAVQYHWWYAIGTISIESALYWFVGGASSGMFLAHYHLTSLVMASVIRRGGSMARAIASGVIVPLLVGGLLIGLYAFVVQEPLSTLWTRAVGRIVQVVQDSVQFLGQSQEIDEEQLRLVREELPQLVVAIFPAMLVMNYLLVNTFTYLLARRYCRQSQPPRYLEPEDVTQWQTSDYLVWVFLGSGAALFVPPLNTLALNVFLITLVLYFMHGLAIATFWGRRLPLPPGIRSFLAVMLFIVAGPFCILLCTAAGLFDLWVDFRRLRHRAIR